MARSPSSPVASLRKARLAQRLGVPAGRIAAFYISIGRAIATYQDLAKPKGHPDSPAMTAKRFRSVGKAASSGSSRRVATALAGLTTDQRARLEDLAGASSAWSRKPTAKETAAAAVVGSGTPRSWSAKRQEKQGTPPPRTLAAQPGGRPAREEVAVLVSLLAAALAGATDRSTTRGSKNTGAGGTLIPSALERLVQEVQVALGETDQWNAVDRVRAHIAARGGKQARRRKPQGLAPQSIWPSHPQSPECPRFSSGSFWRTVDD